MKNLKKAIITIIKVLTFFIGWVTSLGLAFSYNIVNADNFNPAIWRFLSELIPFLLVIIFTLIFLAIEKGSVKLPIAKNMARGVATGGIVGVAWIGTSIAILLFLGQLTIEGKNEVSYLWLWIFSACINVMMQELLVRGYIYQLLKTKYNLTIAVMVSTMLFTLLHVGAFEAGSVALINVATMCLFTTFLYEYSKTLIAPILAHAIWNIVGAIIFGGASLADDYPHIFNLSLSPRNNTLLSGGKEKIEASIIVTILNTALLILFWWKYRKTKKSN